MSESQRKDEILLQAMTYWDEPVRRQGWIRTILLVSVGAALLVQHLLPVVIGLILSGFLYFRNARDRDDPPHH